jgi:Signal transduction histidine kinase
MSFILLYIFAAVDLIRWYTIVTGLDFLIKWAMLLFIVIMLFSIIMQMAQSEIKLQVYSEQIRLQEEILEEKKRLLLEMSNYDKMKTDFFVNVSHELRTPLNIICSTLQLINLYIDKERINFGEVQLPKHLANMKHNCYRLIRLVNNIIDITKIDSGYMEPVFEKLDIVSTVEDITLSTVDYVNSKEIELCFDTDIEEKFMCFDQDKIERIMLNLLSNAVKFSNSGSTITVELHDKIDSICISIKDTGIGMKEDDLHSIFERFVQVDKSLNRAQEGSGIGLSLVKSLVDLHNGTISVQSEYGKGTIFTITLPATLPETNKEGEGRLNIPAPQVEKVHIEFSDVHTP